jgi:hypothetical protein
MVDDKDRPEVPEDSRELFPDSRSFPLQIRWMIVCACEGMNQ